MQSVGMRCLAVVGVAAALLSHQDAVVHGRSLLDFDAGTASASLRGAGTVVGGDSSAAVDVSEVPVPSTAVSASSLQPQSIMFNSAGSLDVGTLIVDEEASSPVASKGSPVVDNAEATSAPPSFSSGVSDWVPGGVRSVEDGSLSTADSNSSNKTKATPLTAGPLRTDVAGMSFSALPVTVNIDIQGFPFEVRALSAADKESAVATNTNATDDDGWWRTRVCGSTGDACALVSVYSETHRRRLAGAVTKPREAGDLSDVESSLKLAAVTKTGAALFLVAAGFASAPFALVLGTFAFVLSTLFAASANDAYIALLKAVNAQYGELNDVIQETADRITAAAEVRSMRTYVKQAIAFHTELTSAAASADASQPGAIAIRLKQTCESKPYRDVKDGLFNTQRIKQGIDQYYVTRARGYVGECAYYLRGLTLAYLSYTKCELALKVDVSSLMGKDKSLRSQMNQVARDMGATAEKMLQGFTSSIKGEVEKLVVDGGELAPVTSLNDKYDWLTFKAIKSDSGLCSDVTTGVVDVECGLVMVSKHRCQFITWYNTTAGGEVKSGLDLYKTYNGLPENTRCGYGSVLKTGKIATKRPMQRQLSMEDAASSQRRLVSAEQLPFSVYVKANRAKGSSAPVQEVIPEGTIDDATLNAGDDPLQEQLNNAKTEKERMKILADSYTNTSAMSKSIKSRDMAVWFTLETNLKEVNDMYDERDTMVDGISTTVKNVHVVEMGRIKGIYNDVVTTGTQEVQALVDLEVQTTGQHNEEISEMGTIDGQLTTLSSTLDSGFSGTSSDIDTVERDTTAALGQLSNTVTDTGAKTRTEVKKVIAQAAQKTLEHLDGLDDLIATKAQEKLGAVRGLQTLVENAGTQIRNAVATEFNARAQQLQDRVAGLTYHLSSVGSATSNALITETDAMRTELGRRIAFMTNQLEIIDGHINATEKALSTINTQVDDILDMVGSLNTRLTGIFRTMRDLPNRIRQVVMVKGIEDKFRDGERLSFAYANYIKHSMGQLQAFEFIQQCDAVTEALLFDSLLDRLKRGEAVLQKELATFNNSRTDYEQYGNRIAAAAYHLRYMLVPCANMRTLKRTGKAEFGEATSRSQADKLNTAIWTFQQSMEETAPQLFLKKIYTASYLQSVLDDTRRSVGSSGVHSVAAIEPLRYQFQQQLGSYAVVTVIQPDQKNRLTVWTKASKVSVGASRYGMLRLSTLLPTVAASDELLLLWSNTRQQIPTSLRSQFNIPLTKSDLASDATMTTAFKNTAYEPFWTAGLIQSVVFVERVNKTMCPWAVATSHYPYCWETGSYDDGGCVCVQIEGLASTADAAKMAADEGPTPWAVQTTLSTSTPRANFLITALNKATTTALTTTMMVGVPENRRAFALCMSSPLPSRECLAGRWCHQPPPSFTRCIANSAETYNIVYANDTSAQVFIKDGLSVTATMFRTLELGPSIPDITFFDSQNGLGGYIVCADCTMEVLKSIYMFRVMSFKVGRPALEKTSICRQHPRFNNVEFCTRGAMPAQMWTPQTMLQGEMIQSIQQLGSSLPANITDAQELAVAVNTRVQVILGTEVSYFKVYVAKSGSFNASTNANAYWTSLPSQEAGLERGWTVVPGLYSTISSSKVFAFDALIMWSTLPVEARNFAKLVVEKKPAGQPLKTYLQSTFAAYDREKILRGFFSEPFDGLDCPVAGDTDHFAYCTPVPVDKMCSCVQLEDLPEEYTELYDGSAINGKVVSYVLEDDQSAYIVGRSKGSFSLGDRVASATWDGLPMRNVSEHSVCMADYNHPELGASCFVESSSTVADAASLEASPVFPRVQVGVNVAAVTITTPTWTAQCTGCSNAFVSEITGFGTKATVTSGGFVAGGACHKSPAVGGGEIQVCLNQNV